MGYDSEAGIPKNDRVDKMLNLELTEERREGKDRGTGKGGRADEGRSKTTYGDVFIDILKK